MSKPPEDKPSNNNKLELIIVDRDEIGSPKLSFVDGSEIEACVDATSKGNDGLCRPVMVTQDMEFLELTIQDAQRLLAFLEEAIPYLEGKIWQTQ